ncbi:MAG: ComF family protein [Clostridia bacterium]|nr:ComF family protein [Clostridia bacterium]
MLDAILKIIFPPRCAFCNSILSTEPIEGICEGCYKRIPFFVCDSLYINTPGQSIYYDRVICACEYSGIIKQTLMKYKYFNKPSYYRAFAAMLSNRLKNVTNCRNFDIIIGVPLYKGREKDRGYNQARLISKALSKKMLIPDKSWLLSRVRDTGNQSLLTKKQRSINIRDAFKVNDASRVKGRSIILIDDIFTTGNTVNECSRVLKEAGALSVVVCVIASGRKY